MPAATAVASVMEACRNRNRPGATSPSSGSLGRLMAGSLLTELARGSMLPSRASGEDAASGSESMPTTKAPRCSRAMQQAWPIPLIRDTPVTTATRSWSIPERDDVDGATKVRDGAASRLQQLLDTLALWVCFFRTFSLERLET